MNLNDRPLLSLLHEHGAKLWMATYAKSQSDQLASESIIRLMYDSGFHTTAYDKSRGIHRPSPELLYALQFSAKWVDGGCRIIQADEKYFSAMAQTKLNQDASEDLHIPYPAWIMKLPEGLMVGGDGCRYELACFCQMEGLKASAIQRQADGSIDIIPVDSTEPGVQFGNKHSFISLMGRLNGEPMNLWDNWPESLADSLFSNHDWTTHLISASPEIEINDSDKRIREMVKRACVGLLYTMQHTNNWRFGSTLNRAGKRIGREPPSHRAIVIGKPISVDVSQSVRDDSRTGRHGSPTVQTLVRGHIKRQVIGVGRTGRKVIWVEPYWRGPEDAPILARPYAVGTSK